MDTILRSSARPKTPWHLWVIGIFAVLWNLGGAVDYCFTMFRADFYMGQFAQEQLDFFYNFPSWAVSFWALGVWGAMLGSLLTLLRSRLAVWCFTIAIIGLLGTTIYQFGIADMPESLSTSGNKAFTVAIWVVTILLLLYTSRMTRAGVLR